MIPLWENVVKPLWGFPRVSGDDPAFEGVLRG